MMQKTPCAIVLSLCLTLACDEQSVLGEQQCSQQLAGCRQTPNVFILDADKYSQSSLVFDVVAGRTLSPSWQHDLPTCSWTTPERTLAGLPCLPSVRLVPGAEGATWLVNVQDEERDAADQPLLIHLSADGQQTDSVPREPEPELVSLKTAVTDGSGGIVLVTTRGPNIPADPQLGHVYHRRADGSEQSFVLEVQEPTPSGSAPGFSSLAFLPDESMRTRTARYPESAPQTVWSFDARGRLAWSEQYVPALNLPFASPPDGNIPELGAAMPAGGYAFMGILPITPASPHSTFPGVIVVDEQGKLRWAAALNVPPSSSSLTSFAVNQAGQLAITQGNLPYAFGASTVNGGLQVDALDADGNYLTKFWGLRHDYADVSTQQVVVDAAGDIFALVPTGDRDTPQPTVCKLHPGAEPSAECATLALCSDPGKKLFWRRWYSDQPAALDMASPEAGALVLSLSYACAAAELVDQAIAADANAPLLALEAMARAHVIRVDM